MMGFKSLQLESAAKSDFTNLYVLEQDCSHTFIKLLIVIARDKMPDSRW